MRPEPIETRELSSRDLKRTKSENISRSSRHKRVPGERDKLRDSVTFRLLDKSKLEEVEIFLQDALHYREIDYRRDQISLRFYRFRFGSFWRGFCYIAAWVCVLGSFLETNFQTVTDFVWVSVSFVDVFLNLQFRGTRNFLAALRNQVFVSIFVFMAINLAMEAVTLAAGGGYLLSAEEGAGGQGGGGGGPGALRPRGWAAWVAGALRPAALAWADPGARGALHQVVGLLPRVAPMLALELFLIAVATCLCVTLYGFYDDTDLDFSSAPAVFVELFQLQTTVNDPDVWLPLYAKNPWNALMFIGFLVTNLFFMHNILLAVVYEAFAERRARRGKARAGARRAALRAAFRALTPSHQVAKAKMLELFAYQRPHYSPEKLEALYHRVDPEGAGAVGADEFPRVLRAMGTHVHAPRDHDFHLGPTWKLLETGAGAVNVLFVLYACTFEPMSFFFSEPFWVMNIGLSGFFLIKWLFDLGKYGPRVYFQSFWRVLNFLAVMCSVLSAGCLVLGVKIEGEVFWQYDPSDSFNRLCLVFIMFSRCLDMLRVIAQIRYFRDVMATVMESIPSIYALFLVIFTFFHVFCYVGMAIWGGKINKDTEFSGDPHFYFLNNFNSYREGLVTAFELLVVNNWNVVSSGYFNESKGNYFIYFFFISFNIFVVTVLMNLFTSFFISAFLLQHKDREAKAQNNLDKTAKDVQTGNAASISLSRENLRASRRYTMVELASPRTKRQPQGPALYTSSDDEENLLGDFSRRRAGSAAVIEQTPRHLSGVEIYSASAAAERTWQTSSMDDQVSRASLVYSRDTMGEDEIFDKIAKVDEVSTTVVLKALSTMLDEGIRVVRSGEVIFESQSFKKAITGYGKKGDILRFFGPAIQDFEAKDNDSFPLVLASNTWNSRDNNVRNKLKITCCIAQLDPKIILYTSSEVVATS